MSQNERRWLLPPAFFQDDRPSYNEAAAKDAWPRMLDWFRKYLPSA